MTHLTLYRGFALPTLMMMLALTSIATLLALRTLWVNDKILKAGADQVRNHYKADALLPLALADIVGSTLSSESTSTHLRHTVGETTQTHAFFPVSLTEYEVLRQRLSTNLCSAGICAPNTLDPKATQASYWKAHTATAMPVSAADIPDGDNTAWYWVEIFAQTSPPTFIYRITTFIKGVMPGSSTVLQAIWIRDNLNTRTGHWQSWHVLHD